MSGAYIKVPRYEMLRNTQILNTQMWSKDGEGLVDIFFVQQERQFGERGNDLNDV